MADDPYRTPGEVISDEERRDRWQREYLQMGMCDVTRYTPEQRAQFEARYAELQRRLAPKPLVTANRVDTVKALTGAVMDSMTDDERAELFAWLRGRYCQHCGNKDPRCQCWNDE